jgi:hypothetical protein
MDEAVSIDFERVAAELDLSREQVAAVAELLDQGNTVPYITRYRKERTGNLDETAIREIPRRVGRLTHRWVSQAGQHGKDERRGQPSRNPHCVGTGAHSLAVVEGSGSGHRLGYSLAHAPRHPTRAGRPLLRSYS